MDWRRAAGPVFVFECLTGARRRQVYVGRVLFVLTLLAGLWLIWAPADRTFRNLGEISEVGHKFFITMISIQFVAVLLVSPAATAGAICVDKSRGTLLHALVTDLGDREIVVGKLVARLVPVLALMLCGLPVLALSGLLGGIDSAATLGAYITTTGVAVLSCAIAQGFSVWAKKPHQALLPTYGILGVWIAIYPVACAWTGWNVLPPWTAEQRITALSNPWVATFLPIMDPGQSWLVEQVEFLAVTTLLAGLIVTIAVLRLRSVVLGQVSRPARRGRPGLAARVVALLPEPSIESNPVLWREWHRKRPSRWTGRFWAIYTVVSACASVWVIVLYFMHPLSDVHLIAAQINGWEVALGLLLLSVSAATTLAEERDRGSLDVIMATPLSTQSIVLGKWWGTFAMVPRLSILPIWVTCGLGIVSERPFGPLLMIGLIFAYAAAITSVGLAFGTWFQNPGRAVAASVLAFALMSVGWSVMVRVIGTLQSARAEGLLKLQVGNPYFGIALMTEDAGRFGVGHGYGWRHDWIEREPWWALFWICGYTSLALLLLGSTLRNFDRRLGRVPETVPLVAAGPTRPKPSRWSQRARPGRNRPGA